MDKDDKTIVNYYLILEMLDPVMRHVDYDEEDFPGMDVNSLESVKSQIIRPILQPFFQRWDETSRESAKNSLRYFLNIDAKTEEGYDLFDRLFAMASPGFSQPKNPRDFFVWLWQELFNDEDYHIKNIDDYIQKNDGEALKHIRISRE